jgi:hypothetical protein
VLAAHRQWVAAHKAGTGDKVVGSAGMVSQAYLMPECFNHCKECVLMSYSMPMPRVHRTVNGQMRPTVHASSRRQCHTLYVPAKASRARLLMCLTVVVVVVVVSAATTMQQRLRQPQVLPG